MADNTAIEWADATWNPITGCSIVSPECTHCYAMRLAGGRMRNHPSRQGLTEASKTGPVWNGIVRLNEEWLDEPLRWRRPRRIFVCAHGDLFHEAVPDDWIDRVFAVMALCPQHIFIVLTKRTKRMRQYLSDDRTFNTVRTLAKARIGGVAVGNPSLRWPLPNVWAGTSVERQLEADERIPELLATPAAVRGISAEPLLAPVDLTNIRHSLGGESWEGINALHPKDSLNLGQPRPSLNWVICGGESGPGARPMHPTWARSLRDQCTAAGVPFFFKQWGEWLDADHRVANLRAAGIRICRDDGDALNGGWNPTPPLTFDEGADLAGIGGFDYEHQSDGSTLIRVGKRAAGRLLDGREWNEFPARDG